MTLLEERIIAAIWGETRQSYRNIQLSYVTVRGMKNKKSNVMRGKSKRLKIS